MTDYAADPADGLTEDERESLRFLVNNRSAFDFEQAVTAVEAILAARTLADP